MIDIAIEMRREEWNKKKRSPSFFIIFYDVKTANGFSFFSFSLVCSSSSSSFGEKGQTLLSTGQGAWAQLWRWLTHSGTNSPINCYGYILCRRANQVVASRTKVSRAVIREKKTTEKRNKQTIRPAIKMNVLSSSFVFGLLFSIQTPPIQRP
jgi:hypothetical protein